MQPSLLHLLLNTGLILTASLGAIATEEPAKFATSSKGLDPNGTHLEGSNAQSQPRLIVEGKAVEGRSLQYFDANGNKLPLRVSEPELDPRDPTRETYLYTIFYQDSNDSQWYNLCTPDADREAKAMLLWGHWDETGAHIRDQEITIACTSGVLAKCVRWGYRPWQSVNGVPLRDFHQACTRMARADYCGNGNSHTKDGTLIDLYDRLAIQSPTEDSGLEFEAAWSPEGAVLLHHTRWGEPLAQIAAECPERLQGRIHEGELSEEQVRKLAPDALLFNRSSVR